jgi:FkbM family methyltransferase
MSLRALRHWLRPPSYDEVEREELAFYRAYLRPGMTVVDVGANVGMLASLFARLAAPGPVHAFEPGAAMFAQLEASIAGAANVTANRLALADRAGTLRLNCYEGPFHPFSTLAERPLAAYGVDAGNARQELVEATTLDAYCGAKGISGIDLLKIDVEGAELQVLQGAARMLCEKRIACVAFEFGQATFDMGNRPAQLADLFRAHDYRVTNLVRGARLFPGGRDVSTARFAMHLARPR